MGMTKTMKTTTRHGITVRTNVQAAAPNARTVQNYLNEANGFRQMRGQELITEAEMTAKLTAQAQEVAEHAGPASRKNLRTGNRPMIHRAFR